jgi:inorganic pyrophosphatase
VVRARVAYKFALAPPCDGASLSLELTGGGQAHSFIDSGGGGGARGVAVGFYPSAEVDRLFFPERMRADTAARVLRGMGSSWSAPCIFAVLLYTFAWATSPRRAGLLGGSQSSSSLLAWHPVTHGQPNTLAYRVRAVPAGGAASAASYWHDIPLYRTGGVGGSGGFRPPETDAAADGTGRSHTARGPAGGAASEPALVTFVCEIPRGTKAKMEVQKEEPLNPIAQDTKDGKLRAYPWPSLTNYGALPRTYEHPGLVDKGTGKAGELRARGGAEARVVSGSTLTPSPSPPLPSPSPPPPSPFPPAGDGDPIDAVDLCPTPCESGSVYQVTILGALAMVDGDATDWKIVTARRGCFGGSAQEEESGAAAATTGKGTAASPSSPASPPLPPLTDLADILPTVALVHAADGGRPVVRRNEKYASSLPAALVPTSTVGGAAPGTFPYSPAAGPGADLVPPASFTSASAAAAGRHPSRADAEAWTRAVLPAMLLWFRDYKLKPNPAAAKGEAPLVGTPNSFDFGGAFLDAPSAAEVVRHTHAQWCALVLQEVAAALNHGPPRSREGGGATTAAAASASSPSAAFPVPSEEERTRLRKSLGAVYESGVYGAGFAPSSSSTVGGHGGGGGGGGAPDNLVRLWRGCRQSLPPTLAENVFRDGGVDWVARGLEAVAA